MNLDAALTDIAARYGLPDLHFYAAEDIFGGFDGGAGEFPTGSLWTVEGKVLWSLARALRARRICEIGTHYGASATHMAAAMRATQMREKGEWQGKRTVYAIDPWEGAGGLIPDDLRGYVHQEAMPGEVWLAQQKDSSLDLIFEDANHDEDTIEKIGNLAKTKLRRGGMLVSHDAAHASAGEHVCEGLRRAGLDFTVYSIEPSDCGLALWRRPL